MITSLNISSKTNLDKIATSLIEEVSPDKIDYIYLENQRRKKETRFFLSIKANECLCVEKICSHIADYILKFYEKPLIYDILKEQFIDFSPSENAEILKNAQKSIGFFDKLYCKRLIVNNLTNYLSISTNLSIEGFLRFRLKEYRRIIKISLSDAIEELFLKKEYEEFIELLKSYISYAEPLIDLLHIRPEYDGGFTLYDFKKSQIILEKEKEYQTEIFLTEDDMLMNVLIKATPRRIIWHNNCETKNQKLVNTIKEVFGARFTECAGCELCFKS